MKHRSSCSIIVCLRMLVRCRQPLRSICSGITCLRLLLRCREPLRSTCGKACLRLMLRCHQRFRSSCIVRFYYGILVRCRRPFRFDLCEFPLFQPQSFRLMLAPIQSAKYSLWLTGRLALSALSLFKIGYLRISTHGHQPLCFGLHELPLFQPSFFDKRWLLSRAQGVPFVCRVVLPLSHFPFSSRGGGVLAC